MTDEVFARFQGFIEPNLGIRMPPAKKILLESRLAKRLRVLKLDSYEAYADYVFSPEGFEREIQQLVDVVTTNETDFFREIRHFDFLRETVLPELLVRRGLKELNVWSVAASTGQEAFTLAMTIEEFLAAHRLSVDYSILATDISEKVLAIGRTGIYTEHQASKIPHEFRRRYCMRSRDPADKTLRFKPALRDRIKFRKLNLMDDQYPLKRSYQIVFCRNVFIYFDRPTQKAVIERLCAHMDEAAYLFMGHSENLGVLETGLKSVSTAVYRKVSP